MKIVKKENRGGKRAGAGRKKLPTNLKKINVCISLSPINHKRTKKNRSEIIENALNNYL